MNTPRFGMLLSVALLLTLNLAAQPPQPLLAKGATPIGWNEFFKSFPQVRMGMTLAAAKRVIVKSGVRPVSMPGNVAEVVWNTKFDGVEGRGTLLLKPRTGVWEVAVVVYGMEEQAAITKRWREKVELRHGPPTEVHDDEYAISYVWRFKKGWALELRSPKDVNSPIVDIHWVKE